MDEAATRRAAAIVASLRERGSEANKVGMARYGINVARAYGVQVAVMRLLAKEIGRDPDLARALWATGLHEARILACRVHDPARATREELEAMAADLDSWDLCDQFTNNLVRRVPEARDLARGWLRAEAPFVKRAGLTLLASLAVHDKAAAEAVLLADLEAVAAVADDDRQPVRKAVSWALRQIGKRNATLCRAALDTAEALLARNLPGARFAARDARRELSGRLAPDKDAPPARRTP